MTHNRPPLKALVQIQEPSDSFHTALTGCSPVCCFSSLRYFSYHFFCRHQKWPGQHCINIQSISHRGHRASFCCQEKLTFSQQLNQCFAVIESYYEDAYESDSLKKHISLEEKIFNSLNCLFLRLWQILILTFYLAEDTYTNYSTFKMETLPFILNVAFDFV